MYILETAKNRKKRGFSFSQKFFPYQNGTELKKVFLFYQGNNNHGTII